MYEQRRLLRGPVDEGQNIPDPQIIDTARGGSSGDAAHGSADFTDKCPEQPRLRDGGTIP